MTSDTTIKVDLCFHLRGEHIPVDHGYALYSALSRVLPLIHDDLQVGVRLIRGRYIGGGILDISPHSELILRLPAASLPPYLKLAGKSIEIFGQTLCIGVPKARGLIPSVALAAHLVSTRNGNDQARFETEMKNQMSALGVNGRLTVGRRRTFEVHSKQVVGYSLMVSELTASESIALQESGLGGRRKMGCGFFEPWEA
jgi:CRISPR-associated protein Cas6